MALEYPSKTFTFISSCALLLTTIGVSAAHAQSTKSELNTLEEVVITAQRREESAQDVAISMTVFSQKELSNANMVNSSDLAMMTPSMSINNTFGPENASFSIRGFTQELRTTASVGVYFAEVVAPRGQTIRTSGDGAGPGTMFDLQNVQVLKGPQGTLFGRNTTGGAVLMTPTRPGDEFEGSVELSYGDYGFIQKQAVLNIPVSDAIRLRLGIDDMKRDGHLNNITHIGADKLGNANYTAGRLGLVLYFGDQVENYTLVHYADSETKGYSPTAYVCNTRDSAADNPILLFTVPGCQQQLQNQKDSGQDGFYDVVSTVPTPLNLIKDLRVINTFTWDVSENLTLKNILAYMHLETDTGSDVFGTQFTETQAVLLGAGLPSSVIADSRREYSPGISVLNPDRPLTTQETRVAELQAQGNAIDGRLVWQSGIYYEHSQPDGRAGSNSPILISCDPATTETSDPSQFNCFDPLNGALGGVLIHDIETEYLNRAVYSQATFDFSEHWNATLGLRYTKDKTEGSNLRTIYRFAGNVPQTPTIVYLSPKQESKAPTGKFEVQYRPLPEVMAYAKYVRGYRQGGINLASDAGVDSFDKEQVDTFEIGAKTEFSWPVPGRFNIAVFDNDFTDMQLQTGYVSPTAGPATSIFNAGKAKITGVEFDGMLQLFKGFTASVGLSYLDTELVEQDQAANQAEVEAAGGPLAGSTFVPSANVGDELPFTPEMSYNVSVNYRLPLSPEIGGVDLGLTYAYTGKQRATASTDSPKSMMDDFAVLNANLGWSDIFGQPFDLTVFVTNVLDEEYVTFLSGTYSALGFDSRMVGLPRMMGARLKYSF